MLSQEVFNTPGFRQEVIHTSRLNLHVTQAGPPDGPPVVLLHGFPDIWYSYRYQIPALAGAGFRVIVPDQRGYSFSDKFGPYDFQTLAADIAALQDTLQISSSHICGHDWGGALAWCFASIYPERTRQLIIFNAPHYKSYLETLVRHPIQLLKSGYIFFFQFPVLPEWFLSRRGFQGLEKALTTVNPCFMSPVDLEVYKNAWKQPGALSAMLGWYRIGFRSPLKTRSTAFQRNVQADTLVIWGKKDPYLDWRCNETLPHYVRRLQVRYLENIGHWVQMEAPEIVNRWMLDFFNPPG